MLVAIMEVNTARAVVRFAVTINQRESSNTSRSTPHRRLVLFTVLVKHREIFIWALAVALTVALAVSVAVAVAVVVAVAVAMVLAVAVAVFLAVAVPVFVAVAVAVVVAVAATLLGCVEDVRVAVWHRQRTKNFLRALCAILTPPPLQR